MSQSKIYSRNLEKLRHFLIESELHVKNVYQLYLVQKFLIESDYYDFEYSEMEYFSEEYFLNNFMPGVIDNYGYHPLPKYPKRISQDEFNKLYSIFIRDYIEKDCTYFQNEELNEEELKNVFNHPLINDINYDEFYKEFKDILENISKKDGYLIHKPEIFIRYNESEKFIISDRKEPNEYDMEKYIIHNTTDQDLINKECNRKMNILIDFIDKDEFYIYEQEYLNYCDKSYSDYLEEVKVIVYKKIRYLLVNNYFIGGKPNSNWKLDHILAGDKDIFGKNIKYTEILNHIIINNYEQATVLNMKDSIVFDTRTFEFDYDKIFKKIRKKKD